MTKKERIVATLTGIGLFCVAALFSIGIFLGLLDFGTNKNIVFLAALGQMLVSVYGFCSALIPLFFFVAGSFCLSAKWSIQRAFVLLVSIIPFFTLVVTERISIAISDQDTSPLAFVKIFTLITIALLLVALEYLLAVNLASFIEKRISHKRQVQNAPVHLANTQAKTFPVNDGQQEPEKKTQKISFLKKRPSYIKDIFSKTRLAAHKKDQFEESDEFIEIDKIPVQKTTHADTPVVGKKEAENVVVEKEELGIPDMEEEEIPAEKKPSFNWSLDNEGNVKNSNAETKAEIDEENNHEIVSEENAEEEYTIESEITMEPLKDDEIKVSEEDDLLTVEDSYDSIEDSDDIIDQFERESENFTSKYNTPTEDETIEYEMEFEEPENEFASEEPDEDIAYFEDIIEESYTEPSISNEESLSIQDEILEEESKPEEQEEILEEPAYEDRTANFNPDATALGDIFSQMEMDARQQVEENLPSENVDPLAPAVVDSNGNIIEHNNSVQQYEPKTAVTTYADGTTKPIELPPKKKKKLGAYKISTELLTEYSENEYWIIDEETKQAAENLRATLKDFNIEAKVTNIIKGPVVTMFEILPAPGIKLNKIVGLADNIALSLSASSVRMIAPIPGKSAVGIEVPNKKRAIVSFRECIEQQRPEWKKMTVPVVLGKDIQGETQVMDLVKTPHLLIAGSTGAGKSVCVNSMILSILYKRSPSDVKMILIDPKVVELKLYNHIPHLLTPVITEPKKAMQALQYCLCEMERRYAVLDSMGCRDISNYNRKIVEQHIATEKIPYLIVIIDEFADLMATTGKQLEGVVARLCAMSRAVGIHLVLATQRPSVDVITGLIKANIPSRVAFMVAAKTDSRIIIDQVGAEKLLGKGDMLYASATDPFPVRIQGAFVSDQEVEDVVEAVKEWGEPEYIDEEIFVDDEEDEGAGQMSLFNDGADDPLYDKALDIVIQAGKASASYIQRRLSIGYNRAARLVELMEERGIVGPANGSKPREIIHMP